VKGGANKGGARKERVAHNIRDALTEMIAADVRDPRVHAPTMLTVSRVELNVDLSVARCYISIVGDDATADAALEGLGKAAGYLRGPLGRRLGLQRAPELRFLIDPSVDMSEKLASIVREDEERARAAGREVGATPAPSPASQAAGEEADAGQRVSPTETPAEDTPAVAEQAPALDKETGA
jgi:ribosome-binding factor A